MNYKEEVASLVQRYIKESKGRDVPIESILSHPWYKVVGWHWDALVHFKHPGWYKSIEEIEPVEGMHVNIANKGKVERYRYSKGKWNDIGDMTEDMYKD